MSLNGNHVKTAQHPLAELQNTVSTQIIGQHTLVERVLVALLADGHVLLEGLPGLARTLLVKTASGVGCINPVAQSRPGFRPQIGEKQ